MPIEIDMLTSDRFGIVAAQLTNLEAPLQEVDKQAALLGVDLIVGRVGADQLPLVHALEANCYQLMDTLVYYRAINSQSCSAIAADHLRGIRLASPTDEDDIGTIAEAAFADYFGHFHADPRLNNADADFAYVDWARSLTRHSNKKNPVLLFQTGETPDGFLALRRNSQSELEVVLNAVHPRAQGHGIYRRLIEAALDQGCTRGVEATIVSTQINNYRVQKVWADLGFRHYRSLYTFHKWYSKKRRSRNA